LLLGRPESLTQAVGRETAAVDCDDPHSGSDPGRRGRQTRHGVEDDSLSLLVVLLQTQTDRGAGVDNPVRILLRLDEIGPGRAVGETPAAPLDAAQRRARG